MGIPDHLICLLRNPYAGHETTVKPGHRTTYWFQVGKGIQQGCILSPCLFNIYAKYIIRNAGLEEAQAGIKIPGRNISNLRYADDTTFMTESEEELKSVLTFHFLKSLPLMNNDEGDERFICNHQVYALPFLHKVYFRSMMCSSIFLPFPRCVKSQIHLSPSHSQENDSGWHTACRLFHFPGLNLSFPTSSYCLLTPSSLS